MFILLQLIGIFKIYLNIKQDKKAENDIKFDILVCVLITNHVKFDKQRSVYFLATKTIILLKNYTN